VQIHAVAFRLGGTILLAFMLAVTAKSQESDWPSSQFKRHAHDALSNRERHGWRQRDGQWWHYRYGWHLSIQSKRSYGIRKHTAHDPWCLPRRLVVGSATLRQKAARNSAVEAWMQDVRYKHGIRYANIDIAKDPHFHCSPSGVVPIAKTYIWTCAVEAGPCRAGHEDKTKVHNFLGTAKDVELKLED
jgi:hypothetical protein